MLSFFLIYEQRKPQSRELVVISVMCAVGVAGRMLFFWLPQFKPVAAIVILSGIASSSRCGFLIGTVTSFVSNFYFGQGPWTPWQMLAFGFLGFLSGVVFKGGKLSHKRLPLAIFGAVSTLLICGGIVNLGSLLITTGTVTLPQHTLRDCRWTPCTPSQRLFFCCLFHSRFFKFLNAFAQNTGFFTDINGKI